MDSEFPGVVDLNVSGKHYRTLLSTLTKDEDSSLAAMFTGRLPVYKDKDDRYFIEASGITFQSILDFLLYDELPLQEPSRIGHGQFGGGFGGFAGLVSYSTRQIELLYRDSKHLGLKRLTKALDTFQANVVNNKMDTYRRSIRGYDNAMAAILDIIPAESLFHKTEFTLRIKQDLQTTDEEKCCAHECKIIPWTSFQQPYYPSIDAVIKVHFEVNPTVLSALTIDLQNRGYIVQGQMTICGFECKKEVKQSKYIVFGGQRRQCCADELFLLSFRWDTEADVVTHPGLFGTKNTNVGKKGQGNVFGQQKNTGFSFGATPQNQVGSGLFGGSLQGNVGQNQAFGFGATQQPGTNVQGSAFSFVQNGSGFASTQQQVPLAKGGSFGFGGGQTGSGFGTGQQATPFAQGNSFGQQQQSGFGQSMQQNDTSWGSSQFQKQQGSSLFGTSAFSNQQNVTSVQDVLGTNQSTFAGKPNKPFGQTQHVQQKVATVGGFSFNSPPKQQTKAFAVKASEFQKSPQSIFGSSPNKSQHAFGGTPSFESKFGALNIQQQQTTPTVKPDQSSGMESSPDDKSNTLFGKPIATAGVFTTEDNKGSFETVNKEQV